MELFDTTHTKHDANTKEYQCIVASIKEDGRSIKDKIDRLINTINVVEDKLTRFTDFEGFLLDIEIYFADSEEERTRKKKGPRREQKRGTWGCFVYRHSREN